MYLGVAFLLGCLYAIWRWFDHPQRDTAPGAIALIAVIVGA
jgi:HAMP domain-containing protein